MIIVPAELHYDLLVTEGNDPFSDPPLLESYMKNWDGEIFYKGLPIAGSDVLEVGVGTGRLAKQFLRLGCRSFTGIDISRCTVERASENLQQYRNCSISHCDVGNFGESNQYDIAYSVLTFMHIENKELAIRNIHRSLRTNGIFAISVSVDSDWLEAGERKIKLHPEPLENYYEYIIRSGFAVLSSERTPGNYSTIIKCIKAR